MRGPIVAGLWMAAALLGAGLAACFDLFHTTRDVLTLCEIDAQAADCGSDANDGAVTPAPDAEETDFCVWPSAVARAHARHACTWLAACETPMGRNAYGSCLFDALLAYDCAANPNHRVKGKARQLWDCLWRVNSCDDVNGCVFPGGLVTCANASDFVACGVAGDAAGKNGDVRIECRDRVAHGENCALWGKTCSSEGGAPTCTGIGGGGCTTRACFGHALGWCSVQHVDVGIDCEGNGAQECRVIPDAQVPDARAWAVCAPESDAGHCIANTDATCLGGTAASCPSGVWERIDCAGILEAAASCNSGPLEPPFDWTSPCALTPPECDADECTEGGHLKGCVRGAMSAPLDCVEAGLGACHAVVTDGDAARGAACAPP